MTVTTTTSTTKELLDSPVLKSAISKASFRLMPMLVILYVVAFLDRTNVGFAEAALEVDKGITAGGFFEHRAPRGPIGCGSGKS